MTRDQPVITTPTNGKRWAWDTIGKAVAAVLVIIALAVWSRALVIYGLPPRMDAAEKSIGQLQAVVYAPASPMPESEVKRIAAAVVAALPKKGK